MTDEPSQDESDQFPEQRQITDERKSREARMDADILAASYGLSGLMNVSVFHRAIYRAGMEAAAKICEDTAATGRAKFTDGGKAACHTCAAAIRDEAKDE